MAFLKWWFPVLLAVFACLQIARAVTDGTATSGTKFPDLYEASVLELQAGLHAGHFSSVDLVKVMSLVKRVFRLFFVPQH